jgi:hypothetical protein
MADHASALPCREMRGLDGTSGTVQFALYRCRNRDSLYDDDAFLTGSCGLGEGGCEKYKKVGLSC